MISFLTGSIGKTFITAFAIIIFLCGRYFYERIKKKKTHEEAMYSLIMDNSVFALIGAAVLILILLLAGVHMGIKEIIDIKALSTIIIAGIAGLFLMLWRNYKVNKYEDAVKLTRNYGGLLKKYPSEKHWFEHDNTEASARNFAALERAPFRKTEFIELKKKEKKTTFPVIVDHPFSNAVIEIKDSKDMYEVPEEIKPYENDLFKAHDTSHIYNQLNVRVKDWKLKDNKLTIETGRTTYFKSMVTNRAIDYRMKNEMTVRDILQYGPFVPSLKESLLSNHLGFNGFIISSDNKLPLVKRKNDMSIGKNTYGPSIGASLKTMYCLDAKGNFTKEGLLKGIRKEINDELKIDEDDIKGLGEDSIIAAYRDIVEGNKPQLLFYYRINRTSKEIQDAFTKAMKEKHENKKFIKSKEEREEEDGTKLLWIDVDKIRDTLFLQKEFYYEGKRIKSVPSATVSLILLDKALHDDWPGCVLNNGTGDIRAKQ